MTIRKDKPFVVILKPSVEMPSLPDPIDCETAFGMGKYAIAWQLEA